jgi:hypothetical protein
MAGAVHPHCQCYYEYLNSVPGDALSIDEWESARRDWAGEWLKSHPPVTERHFAWTDSLNRIANFNPEMYLDGELIENATYMAGALYMSGAIVAPQPKEDRPPGATMEDWGYE